MYNCVIDIALIGCTFDEKAVFDGLVLPEDCEIKLSEYKSEGKHKMRSRHESIMREWRGKRGDE